MFASGRHDGLGGKGANQAIAAAILGRHVHFVGQVGNDESGRMVLDRLDASGVDTTDAVLDESEQTGVASITVNKDGENFIIVHSGANATLGPETIEEKLLTLFSSVEPGAVVLCQGELSSQVVEAVARLCAKFQFRFVLNLAPFIEVNKSALAEASPLVVNEGEARAVAESIGMQNPSDQDAESLVGFISETLATSVVITLGGEGSIVSEKSETWLETAFKPPLILDTTGAGDVYTGVLASILSQGNSLREAVRIGSIAGGIAVSRHGASSSYPSAEEIRAAAALSEDDGEGRRINKDTLLA